MPSSIAGTQAAERGATVGLRSGVGRALAFGLALWMLGADVATPVAGASETHSGHAAAGHQVRVRPSRRPGEPSAEHTLDAGEPGPPSPPDSETPPSAIAPSDTPAIEPPARDLVVEQDSRADAASAADGAGTAAGDVGGGWSAARAWLRDEGIDLTLAWVADLQGNATGGHRRKVRYFQDVGAALTFDLARLMGVPNTRLETGMSSRAGNDLSSDIGNDFIVADTCCGATIRLTTLSLETTWMDERVALRAGRLSVGDDFAASQSFLLW